MCIISDVVNKVAKTKILVGLDKTQTKQITIYSNYVDNEVETNAMILSVLNPKTVQFIDLSKYTNFFDTVDKMFPQMTTNSYSKGITLGYNTKSAALPIFNVGSYKVSLAMNTNDLMHIDKSEFTISNQCIDMLKSSYADYGFIICKLTKGKEEYHPIAYSNTISNNHIFIPTRHYHEHQSHNNLDNFSMFKPFGTNNLTNLNTSDEDWDHLIYLYNCIPLRPGDFLSKPINWIGFDSIDYSKINFNFDKLQHFEKYNIKGEHKNIDLIAKPNYDYNGQSNLKF